MIENFLPAILIRRTFHKAHDVRNNNGALGRDDKYDIRLVFILAAIGIEIIIKQDRDFTGKHSTIRGLLGNDRAILGQFFEIIYIGVKVIEIEDEDDSDVENGSDEEMAV